MSNHYFTPSNDKLISKPQQYTVNVLDKTFTFKTDRGVFSKNFLDFGSYVLLKNFKPNGKKILDVGCGYGPLGIIISKIYDLEVLMLDINNRAVSLAKENILENQATKVNVKSSNLYEVLSVERFDTIISNPPIRAGKSIIYTIYDNAPKYLNENGELWIVVQKKQGALSTFDHLKGVFGNCTIVKKEKGYFILKSVKNPID